MMLRALLVFCFCSILPPAARADVLINSFETNADIERVGVVGAQIERSDLHTTDGETSLRIRFQGAAGAGVHFPTTGSWWPMTALSLDLFSANSRPVSIKLTLDSSGPPSSLELTLEPGQPAHVQLPVEELARGAVSAQVPGSWRLSGGAPVLLTTVSGFTLSPDSAAGPFTLYVDNVHLIPASDGVGLTLVDDLGQYAPLDWVGKVNHDSDLEADAAVESETMAEWRRPADLDRFGGKRGGRFRQDPFFSVQQSNGRWSLVDPAGNEFFVMGVNEVSADSTEAAPSDPAVYSSPPAAPTVNFYLDNLKRKYGANFQRIATDRERVRLHTWGFNAVGPGSDPALRPDFPFVVDLGSSAKVPGPRLGELPDVFAPSFPAEIARIVSAAAAYRESEQLIGFTMDRALPWSRLLDSSFVLANEGPASEWLRGRMEGDRSASGIPTPELMQQFAAEFARRYFTAVSAALRAADHGHHLYLGCRFTDAPAPVVSEAAKVCDVLTFDDFGPLPGNSNGAKAFAGYHRPVLISAFGFSALDTGLLARGPASVGTQDQRAQGYGRYLDAALRSPDIVGCFWDRYLDQPVLSANGAGCNCGLVSVTDRPYSALTSACAAVNQRASRAQAGGGAATSLAAQLPSRASHGTAPAKTMPVRAAH